MASTTDRATPKQRRIIDAARHLVLRQGLRSTTMEAIAREARMAKPTLYSQFPDKDHVFAAVVEDVAETICGAFDSAIEGDAEVAVRIGDALVEKYCTIANLLGGSPHAEDFFNVQHLATDRFKELDEQTETAIANALAQAGFKDERTLAKLIAASAYGIGRKLQGEAEIREGILLICARLIGSDAR